MKLRALFARKKSIRTFEELKKCGAKIIGYHEKPGHREGAGSLYQDILSAHMLCALTGKILACPPVQYLHHHKSAGDTLEAYIKKWADVFKHLNLHQHNGKYSKKLLFLENPKATLDSLPENIFRTAVANLRTSFQGALPRPSVKKGEIVVHLRNGNPEDELQGERAVDYALFSETFNSKLNPKANLKKLLRLQQYLLQEKKIFFGRTEALKMTIISQGKLPGIEALGKTMEVEYCLDKHPVDSFVRMLNSDLLVIGQSSFSYVASLLRQNLSISLRRFRHRLPENCLTAEIF